MHTVVEEESVNLKWPAGEFLFHIFDRHCVDYFFIIYFICFILMFLPYVSFEYDSIKKGFFLPYFLYSSDVLGRGVNHNYMNIGM